jgi:hypothetical protein
VLNSLLSWLFKLFLFALAVIFFAGLAVLALVSLAFALVRWLFTGRPPQVKVVMQQYQGWKARSPLRRKPPRASEVVDAEVREITQNTPRDKH